MIVNQCVCFMDGQYIDGSKDCKDCDDTCKTCNGPSNNDCLTCDQREQFRIFEIATGKCLCKEGYFENSENYCDPCHYACLECDGPLSSDCISCPDSSTFYREDSISEECPCLESYFDDQKTKCVECDSSCLTCNGKEKNQCLTCDEDDERELINESYCGCTNDYYEDTQDNETLCVLAKNCQDGYVGVPIAISSNQIGNQCKESCPTGYIVTSSTTNICNGQCHSSCILCNQANDESACLTCPTELFLNILNETTGAGSCITSSLNCSNNNVGVIYLNGTKLCLSSCVNTSEALNTSFNICESCHEECNTCSVPNDRTKCTSCKSSSIYLYYSNNRCLRCKQDAFFQYYSEDDVSNGVCVWNCSIGFYSDTLNRLCVKCMDTFCLSCSGDGENKCLECKEGYQIFEGECIEIRQCDYSYYSQPTSDGTLCLKECLEGYVEYKNNSQNYCIQCGSNCKTCTNYKNLEVCTSCSSSLYYRINKGLCISSCPEGTYQGLYQSENACFECLNGCSICSNITVCEKCSSGYIMQNDKCLSSCPNQTYANITSQTCEACDETCLICSGSKNSECLECNTTEYQFIPNNYNESNITGQCQKYDTILLTMELIVNQTAELTSNTTESIYNDYILLNSFSRNATTSLSSSSLNFTGHSEKDNQLAKNYSYTIIESIKNLSLIQQPTKETKTILRMIEGFSEDQYPLQKESYITICSTIKNLISISSVSLSTDYISSGINSMMKLYSKKIYQQSYEQSINTAQEFKEFQSNDDSLIINSNIAKTFENLQSVYAQKLLIGESYGIKTDKISLAMATFNISQTSASTINSQMRSQTLQELTTDRVLLSSVSDSYIELNSAVIDKLQIWRNEKVTLSKYEFSGVIDKTDSELASPIFSFSLLDQFGVEIKLLNFETPVLLNICLLSAYKNSDINQLYCSYFDQDNQKWSQTGITTLGDSYVDGCLSCKISHFSKFSILLINDEEINENGVNVCLVCSGIIIFIAFIFAIFWFLGFRFKALYKADTLFQKKIKYINWTVHPFYSILISRNYQSLFIKIQLSCCYYINIILILSLLYGSYSTGDIWQVNYIYFLFEQRDLQVSLIFLIGLLGLAIVWSLKYTLGTINFYLKNKRLMGLLLIAYYLAAIGLSIWRGTDSTDVRDEYWSYSFAFALTIDSTIDIFLMLISAQHNFQSRNKLWKFLQHGGFAEEALDLEMFQVVQVLYNYYIEFEINKESKMESHSNAQEENNKIFDTPQNNDLKDDSKQYEINFDQ